MPRWYNATLDQFEDDPPRDSPGANPQEVTTMTTTVTVYRGRRLPTGALLVTADNRLLDPGRSQQHISHAKEFNWGYGGMDGPAQLALALLLDATGDLTLSLRWYQQFKWDHVARWTDSWEITSDEIRAWIAERQS